MCAVCVYLCMCVHERACACVCACVQAHVCEAAAMPTRWGMVAAQPAIFLSFSPEHQVWSPISLVLNRIWLLVTNEMRADIDKQVIIDLLSKTCVDP